MSLLMLSLTIISRGQNDNSSSTFSRFQPLNGKRFILATIRVKFPETIFTCSTVLADVVKKC